MVQACAAPAPKAGLASPPASLMAYWQGNSAPGRLADSSGHHRDLVAVHSVPNPVSPTPFEGDHWLAADFLSTQGYFKIPPEAIPPNAAGKFSVAFYHATLPCCGGSPHQVILSLRNADGSRYLNLGYADAGIRGFYVDYSDASGALISLGEVASPNLKPQPGTREVVEIAWSAEGMTLVENGVVINRTKAPLDHGIVSEAWLGVQGPALSNSTQNYLDAAAFYSDHHAAYPPVP
jgi:hypothetical protein